MEKQYKISWEGFAVILMSAFVFAIIGYSLPPTIYAMNKQFGWSYARVASYVMAILLFYLINFNTRVIKEKERDKK